MENGTDNGIDIEAILKQYGLDDNLKGLFSKMNQKPKRIEMKEGVIEDPSKIQWYEPDEEGFWIILIGSKVLIKSITMKELWKLIDG